MNILFDWAEVWALLIPLVVLLKKSRQPKFVKPVVIYIWVSLFINLAIDLTWKLRKLLPAHFNSNNYLYNLHAIISFALFSVFFIRLKQPFMLTLKKVIPLLFIVFLIVDFSFFEKLFDYWQFSSRLLAIEAGLLLVYCLLYYFFKVTQEDEMISRTQPDFWIVTGLGIYVAVNFFVFLLYNELTILSTSFAVQIWNVHNISYIIFNSFLARGLYESGRK